MPGEPLFSRLPQDTVVAVRRGGDQLVVCNVESDKYPEKTFSVDPAQARPQRLVTVFSS